jgi:hypothetical protein
LQNDAKLIADIQGAFEAMKAGFPDHVLPVTSLRTAERLFAEGRLSDEAQVIAPNPSRSAPITGRTELTPMKLHDAAPPHSTHSRALKKVMSPAKKAAQQPGQSTGKFVRVWRSKPLSERDLNIPSGNNTNATGSMGFKADAFADIDFQHYFRDEVFRELTWTSDFKAPLKERTTANFQLVIENLEYGSFLLHIAHDRNTESKSYRQRNFTTQLHWGSAKPYIARPDLLTRTLSLYKKNSTPPEYLIEID